MNILMIVDDINIGGTATHILSISKELIKKDFKISIVSGTNETESLFKEEGIEVIHLNFKDDLENICKNIIKYIYKNKINIIHAHLPKSIEIANIIKCKHNIDYIITLHGMFYDDKLINLCKNSSGIICVSHPIKKEVTRVLGDNLDIDVKVIHNFVNIRQNKFNYIRDSLGINDDIKIITYCSRLSTMKGILAEKFLFEFYSVAKDRDDVSAIVIGDGIRKRNIDFYVQSINKSLGRTAIYSIGSVYYPEDYFRESCAIVGTARVILEAISCNVGAIALGSKGYAGLVEPNSYEEMIKTYFGEHETPMYINMSFKESLIFSLDNKDKYNVANENKKWVLSTFNVNNAMKDLINMYKSVKNLT